MHGGDGMAMAQTVQELLGGEGRDYEVVVHPRSHNSAQSAQLAHVPRERLLKSVILADDDGYVMAIVPSSAYVALGRLGRQWRRRLWLATEGEVADLFRDCEPGAIPPFGRSYGLRTVVDDCVGEQPEVYVEAGDHECLVRMPIGDFLALMPEAGHGKFAGPMPSRFERVVESLSRLLPSPRG
jgi:Ala-tRNA(Pro) deacylase